MRKWSLQQFDDFQGFLDHGFESICCWGERREGWRPIPETQRGLQRRERNNVGMVKVHHLGANQVTEQAQDVGQWESLGEGQS